VLHATRFSQPSFVIVSTEVRDPMDQQCHDLTVQRMPLRLGLSRRRMQGDHHVAESPRWGSRCFTHRKGQDVGRRILVTVPVIQPLHAPIANQFKPEFGLGLPHRSQHPLRKSLKNREADQPPSQHATNDDGH
jgi:hypothetical protein